MVKEAKALLDRAAKYIAKGLEMGAYTATVGGDRVAERLLEGIRRYRAETRPKAADAKRLLDRAAQYIGKGLAEGVYTETVGGDLFAERLLDQLEKLRSSEASVRHGTKKSHAQLDTELDTWLREQQEKAARERHVMKQRRLGGAEFRGGRPRPGGRGDI